MRLDIFSDVICPWCFIGKRRLERALKSHPVPGLGIHWRAFQLNPDMPAGGMARRAYREAKFGSLERSRQLDARVAAEGAKEGIAFAFDRMERTPNTSRAHQLIDVAQRSGRAQAVVDALFRAYFEAGRDIGDEAVLAELASAAGVADWPAAADADRVAALEEDVRSLGIQAVPTFILDRRVGVSGAQAPETLAQALRETAEAESA